MTTAVIANLLTAVLLKQDLTKITRLQGIIPTQDLHHSLHVLIPTQPLSAAVHQLHHVRVKATLPHAVHHQAQAEVIPLPEVHHPDHRRGQIHPQDPRVALHPDQEDADKPFT